MCSHGLRQLHTELLSIKISTGKYILCYYAIEYSFNNFIIPLRICPYIKLIVKTSQIPCKRLSPWKECDSWED